MSFWQSGFVRRSLAPALEVAGAVLHKAHGGAVGCRGPFVVLHGSEAAHLNVHARQSRAQAHECRPGDTPLAFASAV